MTCVCEFLDLQRYAHRVKKRGLLSVSDERFQDRAVLYKALTTTNAIPKMRHSPKTMHDLIGSTKRDDAQDQQYEHLQHYHTAIIHIGLLDSAETERFERSLGPLTGPERVERFLDPLRATLVRFGVRFDLLAYCLRYSLLVESRDGIKFLDTVDRLPDRFLLLAEMHRHCVGRTQDRRITFSDNKAKPLPAQRAFRVWFADVTSKFDFDGWFHV